MNKIREYREKAGLTRQKLAEKLDISYTTLYYVEHGRNCSLDIASKFANFFGVKIEDLFPHLERKHKRVTV